MMADDQLVSIYVQRAKHVAQGGPDLIHKRLREGMEVVCEATRPHEEEYVIRLAPGTPFVLRYGEAVLG